MVQCILCAEQAEFVGIAQCNHETICFRCIYKMRVISKNSSCPICKFECKEIIIAEQLLPFQSFTGSLLVDKTYKDILYDSERSKSAFEKLMEFKCSVKISGKPCKNGKKFPSIAFLKKHLKDDHNRYICDVCLEKKTCVLEQHKLYSYQALNKHIDRGDVDQYGNVTFMHPYCKYCQIHFFAEDEFRLHINIEHMNCSVCGPENKYIYYKNYNSLEIHYKISHYICSDPNCVAKKFIAFRAAQELKIHRLQMHDKFGSKKIDARQMCGFKYEGQQTEEEYIQIKDKEGANMEQQFLSLKKTKNRALGQADQQTDALLDIRDFFPCHLNEDDHFEDAFTIKLHKKRTTDSQPATQEHGKKKKKWVEKSKIEEEKPNIVKENEVFELEDLNLLPTSRLSKIRYEAFESHFKRFLREDQISKFNEWRNKLTKGKLTPEVFVDNFFELMKSVSLKSAYEIFPHFVRTIQNQDLKEDLDLEFLRMLKKVPSRSESLVMKSNKYSDFFKTLMQEIESNIQTRIRQRSLSIKNPIRRTKERLYQMIGVVRRLKIQQMAKFKFASNFGLQKDTMQFLMEKVIKMNRKSTQKKLSQITNQQIIDLYVFVKYCYFAISHNKGMHLERSKIHGQVLEDFLYDRPELEIQYGKKKNELNLEEQVQFEKEMEEKRLKNQIKQIQQDSKRRGYDIHTDFNLVDKGDFPELMENKARQQEKREDQFREVVQDHRQKPATYQKKINEMFPTLGQDDPPIGAPTNYKNHQAERKPVGKKELAWWEKLNEKPVDDIEVVNIKKKGKKKKVQWVQVKGLFG